MNKFFVVVLIVQSILGVSFSKETPVFKTESILVGKTKLTAEIAETEDQRAHGLMYRTELKQGHGMLFVFETEQRLGFWMKNTFIPLSIGYFDSKGVLVDIQDMEPVKSEMEEPKTYESAAPAKFALEVPVGWFKKNKIKLGARLVRTSEKKKLNIK